MAESISGVPLAGTLTGDELIPALQNGQKVHVTTSQLQGAPGPTGPTGPPGPTGTAGAGGLQNLLVNGDFQINQRGFAGGALSAGSYGHDRWKAATGGANYSVSSFSVTLTSGTLEQVVETALWGYSSFASLDVTVSVQTLTGGDLTVSFGSQSGSITAGAGVRSVNLTLDAGDTGNLSLKLAVSSGTPVFTRVRLEIGTSATAWSARPFATEVSLCERYFAKSFALGTAPGDNVEAAHVVFGGCYASGTVGTQRINFRTRMRTVPTMTYYQPASGVPGSAGQWSTLVGGWATATTGNGEVSTTGFYVNLTSVSGSPSVGAAVMCAGNWTAAAEL